MAMGGYGPDLAFIHDRGFSEFSLRAADELTALFRSKGLPSNHIVELGCGSGRLAAKLTRRGFRVTGLDASRAMITLARRNAPRGRFSTGSLWRAAIPPCGAVVAVGEVLNYQFNGRVSHRRLEALFRRAHQSLLPSGFLVFDILCTRVGGIIRTRNFVESGGWLVAVEKVDGPTSVVRRIISFRRSTGGYRRSVEFHELFRYNPDVVIAALRRCGFSVRVRGGYGKQRLSRDHLVVIARKTSSTKGMR